MYLYSDRMEIYSPGKLPNRLTIEKMSRRVFTRNELLVDFLSQINSSRTGLAFFKLRGKGVRTILDRSEAHAGQRPVYELHDNELMLTIWSKPSPHEANNFNCD